MKANPLNSMHSAKSPIVFIKVEHLAQVLGYSVNYTRQHFREVKKLAKVSTHGIHIDNFFECSPQIPVLSNLKRDDFSRVYA